MHRHHWSPWWSNWSVSQDGRCLPVRVSFVHSAYFPFLPSTPNLNSTQPFHLTLGLLVLPTLALGIATMQRVGQVHDYDQWAADANRGQNARLATAAPTAPPHAHAPQGNARIDNDQHHTYQYIPQYDNRNRLPHQYHGVPAHLTSRLSSRLHPISLTDSHSGPRITVTLPIGLARTTTTTAGTTATRSTTPTRTITTGTAVLRARSWPTTSLRPGRTVSTVRAPVVVRRWSRATHATTSSSGSGSSMALARFGTTTLSRMTFVQVTGP